MIRSDVRGRVRAVLAAALLVGVGMAGGCSSDRPSWVGGTAPSTSPAGNVSPSGSPSSAPVPAAVDPNKPQSKPGEVMLGAYINLAGKSESQSLALRKQQLGRGLSILHEYYGWRQPMPRTQPKVLPSGATLLISWDGVKYNQILNGSQDTLITQAAKNLKAYHKPVFLRWAWEMNGSWYDWGGPKNGNSPQQFIAAWRHIHDIFEKQKADNVAFVWAPNWKSYPTEPWNDMTKYYPGDDYVDWVGISGYFSGRQTPDELFGKWAAYGERKPLMIAETGAQEHGGSVKSDWIGQLQEWIIAHPAVEALLWFDTDNDHGNGKNWRIDSTPGSLAAYKTLANDPHFAG